MGWLLPRDLQTVLLPTLQTPDLSLPLFAPQPQPRELL